MSHTQQMGRLGRETFESQFSRKYKFANVSDTDLCEREVIRMLKVVRHTFYRSGCLLIDPVFKTPGEKRLQQRSIVSQNAVPKITTAQKTKETSLAERLMELFGSIFEQLAGNARMDAVIEETLTCIVTFASQNIRFKNAFITQCFSLANAKKCSILKILIDRLLAQAP